MIAPKETPSDDLHEALREADCLDIYLGLPGMERTRFSRWVETAPDHDSHWRRIEALVVAMKISPLRSPSRRETHRDGRASS